MYIDRTKYNAVKEPEPYRGEGEFYPWYTRIFGVGKPDYPIKGVCDKKYYSVEKEFRDNFLQGKEVGASVVIFSNEECSVELYGGYSDFENKTPFSDSTLQLVHSCSKILESLGLACMIDRGLLNYDDKVSSIWSEFGYNGKDHVTISNLMRHEGGFAYFEDPQPTFAELKVPEIRRERIINQQCIFEKNQRAYHALNRGLVTNELVERVDKYKRTLNQFYQDEINKPLNVEFYLGLDPLLYSRRSKWYNYPTFDAIVSSWFPNSSLGKHVFSDFKYSVIEKGSPLAEVIKLVKQVTDYENSEELTSAELPSSNGFTNAKTLATIGALLANKGELKGYRLISESGLESALSEPITAFDFCLKEETTFTKAGFGTFEFPDFSVKTKFYGWCGMGGSLMLFNPDYRFSFAYIMNGARFISTVGGKARSLFITAFKAHLKAQK